jgi:hypothetical protein
VNVRRAISVCRLESACTASPFEELTHSRILRGFSELNRIVEVGIRFVPEAGSNDCLGYSANSETCHAKVLGVE